MNQIEKSKTQYNFREKLIRKSSLNDDNFNFIKNVLEGVLKAEKKAKLWDNLMKFLTCARNI